MRNKLSLWILWFALLVGLIYSPLVAPENHLTFIFGIPSTIFWWFLLSIAEILSIILFVTTHKETS